MSPHAVVATAKLAGRFAHIDGRSGAIAHLGERADRPPGVDLHRDGRGARIVSNSQNTSVPGGRPHTGATCKAPPQVLQVRSQHEDIDISMAAAAMTQI